MSGKLETLVRIMRSDKAKEFFRSLLLLASCTVIVCCLTCCVLPEVVFRLYYGRPPLETEKYRASVETVKPGMSFNQVRVALGEPHERRPSSREDEGETWIYYTDSLGVFFLCIQFDKDGQVINTWI